MRLVATAALLVAAAACGGGHAGHGSDAGDAGDAATRTVRIEMRDVAYSPESISVKRGETVRFVFTNRGKVIHDAFVGDEAAQADHEQEMRAGGDEHGHDGGGSVTVAPGKTAELEQTFTKVGTTLIGCHEPGHYDAGMKITVTVA